MTTSTAASAKAPSKISERSCKRWGAPTAYYSTACYSVCPHISTAYYSNCMLLYVSSFALSTAYYSNCMLLYVSSYASSLYASIHTNALAPALSLSRARAFSLSPFLPLSTAPSLHFPALSLSLSLSRTHTLCHTYSTKACHAH